MSSLRNAVKRSTHKERAQPSSRHRFGLLEKKKDYLLRARNHQQKEETLKNLREKAENRNPDEYYPAMQREQLHGTDPQRARMTNVQIQALKAQDLLHVQLQSQKRKKKVEKMQESLHFIGAPIANKHTVFVDSHAAVRSFSAEEHFDTPAPLLGRTFNRPRGAQLEATVPPVTDAAVGEAAPHKAAKHQAKRRAGAYAQLLEARESSETLVQLVGELRAAKTAASRGRRRPVRRDDDGRAGPVVAHRFKRVRQR